MNAQVAVVPYALEVPFVEEDFMLPCMTGRGKDLGHEPRAIDQNGFTTSDKFGATLKGSKRSVPQEPTTISIENTSDLARLLSHADSQPLRITTGTVSYRVTREEASSPIDGASFAAAIDRLAGSWSDEDAEAAIEYLATAREEETRPPTRP